MSAIDSWVEAWRAQAASLPGAGLPWLAAVRQRAIDRFAAEGWPTNRLDNWRHTSLAFLADESLVPLAQMQAGGGSAAPEAAADALASARAALELLRQGEGDGHWLVFVDGRHVPALSAVGALPAGVQLQSLSEALARQPEQVEAAFGSGDAGESPAALNAALAGDGAFIRIARGVVVESPIHLVFIAATSGAASHPRNLITADAGAQATIVEHWLGTAASATLSNAVTRIDAGADSKISHLKVQQELGHAIHLAAIDAVQARGSVLDSHSLSFGARLARNDIGTRFDGEGCEVLLNGLYHVDGKRHVDHHTQIDHAQPRGMSREFYRGILDDSSRGVFSGRILVAPGAARTDAVQRSDSLLLSARAEADSRPELEIYADDVKCAHGATVGQIDEASLFYLRSRGIDEARARNLLTYAFASTALARIGLAPLRRRAEAAIRSRLPGGELMEAMS
jgi:Fe-S cluster assembly protein SufD